MKKFRVSIVQTYILQLKHAFIISAPAEEKVSIVQTSHPSTETAVLLLIVLIFLAFQLYKLHILQLKREEKVIARLPLLGFQLYKLHILQLKLTENFCGNVYGLSFNCTNFTSFN